MSDKTTEYNKEESVKQKLEKFAYGYYLHINENGYQSGPVKKGRLEAAKEIASIFIDEDEIKNIVEKAKSDAKAKFSN
ncbi:hypothetical protein FTO70_08745 [Methanosarcina sp. KYL-1]|uniref:hypothetical protein n=1 Tax=Methanosarcina sp. KYL-1 TaxID=2602068 RepID=UPI0021009F3A|nr:hypothetical protein [Methanosarcina sp. KYL-1]MCQ1535763.1 hypothetical protein [Methanosarcina sp. KYL-1]